MTGGGSACRRQMRYSSSAVFEKSAACSCEELLLRKMNPSYFGYHLQLRNHIVQDLFVLHA